MWRLWTAAGPTLPVLSDVVCNGTSPIPWCKVGAGSLVATRRSMKLRALDTHCMGSFFADMNED